MAKTEERVKEVRQQIWKKRMKKIKLASFIFGIIILLIILLNIKRIITAIFWNVEIFKVKEVKIIPENARSLLTGVLAVENPGNLLFLDIEAWRDTILKIQEIEKCSITKEFPSTLIIEVTLRKPWILIEKDGGGIYIDKEGKVIKGSENTPYFVKVRGIETNITEVIESDVWKLDALQNIERWYNYYNIQEYFPIERIIIIKPTEIILNDSDGNRNILLTGKNIGEQFEQLKLVIEECKKDQREWDYIDVRFKNVAVKYREKQSKIDERKYNNRS